MRERTDAVVLGRESPAEGGDNNAIVLSTVGGLDKDWDIGLIPGRYPRGITKSARFPTILGRHTHWTCGWEPHIKCCGRTPLRDNSHS